MCTYILLFTICACLLRCSSVLWICLTVACRCCCSAACSRFNGVILVADLRVACGTFIWIGRVSCRLYSWRLGKQSANELLLLFLICCFVFLPEWRRIWLKKWRNGVALCFFPFSTELRRCWPLFMYVRTNRAYVWPSVITLAVKMWKKRTRGCS